MEENNKKDIEEKNIQEEELKDFPDDSMFYDKQNYKTDDNVDEFVIPIDKEQEVKEEAKGEVKEEPKEELIENDKKDLTPDEQSKEEIEKELYEISEDKKANSEELSYWEEFGNDNSVVKKYIFYVSKDFVPHIDSLSLDERTAYINDAIQKKIDFEDNEKQKEQKKHLLIHFIIMTLIFLFATPLILLVVHKSIMATFDNYKYSQDNFEKLYKQRFEKDKIYMRFIKFNRELEKNKKKLNQIDN